MYQEIFRSPSDNIIVQKLMKGEDAHKIDIKNVVNEVSTHLNLAMVVVGDELNFLNYSDREEGEPFIELQIINRKNFDYKTPHREFTTG